MPPPANQLTFPRMEQTPRKRGAKNACPKSRTPDEQQWADSLIVAWNAAFRDHGCRANRTPRNRSVAAKLYRWIYSKDNDGEPRMTEGDVLKAIQAYSEDTWIITKCAGRFQSIGDWLRGCPDNVDKQLSRIREKRGAGVAAKAADPAAEFAGELLEFAGLGQLARRATEAEQRFTEHIAAWSKRRIPDPPVTGGRDRHKAEREWRDQAVPIVRAFVQLPQNDRSRLRARASKGAAAYLGRRLTKSVADANLVTAIAIALASRETGDTTLDRKAGTP